MKNETLNHLQNVIIPFWKSLIDKENGGYYGYVDSDLAVDKTAPKGCILNSRILWFFSQCSILLKNDETLLSYATHAYNYLVNSFSDRENGGVYWQLNYNGTINDATKHVYCQAFAIYGLSAYYKATNNKSALQYAYTLFHIIEKNGKDEVGYCEAFSKNWQKQTNEKLSENGVEATRTMNTLLHVFEAYSSLYEADKNEIVALAMKEILNVFINKIYNPQKQRQEVFFNDDYTSLIDLHSFGHDIESAWLIDYGASLLDDEILKNKITGITNILAKNTYNLAYENGVLYNESENSVIDTTQVWWVQAEAVLGFVNAMQKTNDTKYIEAAMQIWQNITENIVDHRPNSEWFWALNANSEPIKEKPMVSPWKCPYHNGRMCIELQRRL